MPHPKTVAKAPDRPTLLIDGGCAFCRRWGARLERWTGVVAVPYQTAGEWTGGLTRAELEAAVQLVDVDGVVYGGAAAAFKALSRRRGLGWLYRFYRVFPVKAASDFSYRTISRRRHRP